MPQTDPKDGNGLIENLDDVEHDPHVLFMVHRARAGRQNDVSGFYSLYLGNRNLIVEKNLRIAPQFAQILFENMGEGIVIVDNQRFHLYKFWQKMRLNFDVILFLNGGTVGELAKLTVPAGRFQVQPFFAAIPFDTDLCVGVTRHKDQSGLIANGFLQSSFQHGHVLAVSSPRLQHRERIFELIVETSVGGHN